MRHYGLIFVVLVAIASPRPAQAVDLSSPGDGIAFFESKIRPVLVESCYRCHSIGEGAKVRGEFRLDSAAGLLKGGVTGQPAVVPGDPEKSLLITAIRYHDENLLMPPKAKLPDDVIHNFETWVKIGAPDPRVAAAPAVQQAPGLATTSDRGRHWAFQPVTAFVPPPVMQTAWVRTDVDRFILRDLEARQLGPVSQADKRTLIRRASFDLIGLPPTPEEVDAFVQDNTPEAYAKLIDRLLASPAYGERWGRHWLDIARYADTAGESSDYPIPQAYKYRDYVIAAFNNDKPYDQFIREQIAGDLLPAASESQRYEQTIATGFIALARRFGVNPESQQYLTIEDTIDTTGKAVLGMALSCARCHDHKFDPIPTSDYYSLYGIFSSTQYPFPGSETTRRQRDFVPLIPKAEAERILAPSQREIDALLNSVKLLKREEEELPEGEALQANRTRQKALLKEIADITAQTPAVPDAYAVQDSDEPADARIQRRGDPKDQTDVVRRGFLTALGGQKLSPDTVGSGRLQLAQWLTDPKNPLTARVMVNRIWQGHFGKGLVATPNDFGARGTHPTNPQLLDYLASQFMQNGWSVKAMHRLIMLSSTYQVASRTDAPAATIDPNNELHWHFERQRLDAEEIRDAMLAVSGTLDRTPSGEHPFPDKSKWNFTQHNPFTAVYESNHRSVYLMVQRIRRHPFLATFDGADPNASTPRRVTSTTPLQALFAMNDPFIHQVSAALADRVRGAATNRVQQIDTAYRLTLSRSPSVEELAVADQYLNAFRDCQIAEGISAGDADQPALASLCRVLLVSNEFLFVE